MNEDVISPAVAREAARWLMRLNDDNASESDHRACLNWRAAHPDHERAWQRAEQFGRQLGAIPPGIAMPTLDRPATLNRRTALKTLALLIAATPLVYTGSQTASWQSWMADVRTQTGERRTLILADGSQLTLNTASAVDIAFDDATRLIRLRSGEIHINTAPDPSSRQRPLVVQTAEGRLTALGTRFNVRQNRQWQDRHTHLAVFEGAVEIRPATPRHPAVIVQAGQQARFDTRQQAALHALSPHADGWRQGILYADNMRLADLVTELARYRPGLLHCDPAVADLRVSGAFQLKNTDDILDLLQQSLPIKVNHRSRLWTSLGPG